MGRILAWAAAVAILAVIPSGAGTARTPGGLTATVAGSRIPLSRVGTLHCHDLEYPVLRCYRTEQRLQAAVDKSLARRRRLTGPASVQALAYVRIYDDATFEGSSLLLTTRYPNLGTIGWNDRISSFKSVNGGVGLFSEHVNGGGADTLFCCNANVSYVGAARNDTFSSLNGSA